MTPKARIRGKADILFFQNYTGECCEVCGSYEVDPAHHFYFKGDAKHLRYYPPNAITLCFNCHHKLHHGGLRLEIEAMIIDVRGDEWFEDLQTEANVDMGSGWENEQWYKNQYNILKND